MITNIFYPPISEETISAWWSVGSKQPYPFKHTHHGALLLITEFLRFSFRSQFIFIFLSLFEIENETAEKIETRTTVW